MTPFLKSSICRKFLNSKQHSHHFMRTIGRWMWLSHEILLVLQLQNGTEGVMRMSWLSIVSIVRGYHWYIHFSFPLSLNNTQFFLLIILEELQDDNNGHRLNSFTSVDSISVVIKFVWRLLWKISWNVTPWTKPCPVLHTPLRPPYLHTKSWR